MIRKPQPKTPKLKGVIRDRNVTILKDSSSTHNCIDILTVNQLNLFVYPTEDLIVIVANEQKVKEVAKCQSFNSNTKTRTTNRTLWSTTQRDKYSVRCKMVDVVGKLYCKP